MEGQKILKILWRRKWIIISALLIIPNMAYFGSGYYIDKTYKASAKIWLEEESAISSLLSTLNLGGLSPSFGEIESQGTGDGINTLGVGGESTIAELITARPILEKVISRLQLRVRGPQKEGGGGLVDPESLRYYVEVKKIPKTNLVELSGISTDPEEAMGIANTLAEVYIEETRGYARERARVAREFIQGQLPMLKQEWNRSLEQLRQYQEGQGSLNINEEARIALEKLVQLLTQEEDIIIDLAENEAKLRALEAQLTQQKEGSVRSSTIKDNPQIQSLKEQLATLKTNISEALTEVTESHPRIIALRRQISETNEKLEAEIKVYQTSASELEALRREVAALNVQLAGIEADIARYINKAKTIPTRVTDYTRLLLTIDTKQSLYKNLLEYQYEVKIAEAMNLSQIRPIEPAVKLSEPFKPKQGWIALIGIIISLMFSLGMVFLVEYLDDTLRTPEEVKEQDLVLLGTIPKFGRKEQPLILNRAPRDPLVESYRIFRNNLRFASPDRPLRTLLITSPGVSEGKSITVANLAISFSRENIKTLVIDADLRNPALHRYFRIPNYTGVTTILSGNAGLEEAIQETPIPGLSILTAGGIPPNPGQLIESMKMRELIEKARSMFDLVILDLPPALYVSDAAILSRHVDGTVFVLEHQKVTLRNISLIREIFRNAGTQVLGVILNKYRVKTGDGYHYRDRYYYYNPSC